MSFLRKANEKTLDVKTVDVTPMKTMMDHFPEAFSEAKGQMTNYGIYQLELTAPKDTTQRKNFLTELNSVLIQTFPYSPKSSGEVGVSMNLATNSTLITASGDNAPKLDAIMTELGQKNRPTP